MMDSSNITFDRIGRDLALPVAQRVYDSIDNAHYKYTSRAAFEFLIAEYYHCFKYIEYAGYKKVLDFGCGVGMSQMVHDMFDWNFEIELCDLHTSWSEDEKDTFDLVRSQCGIDPLMVTDIIQPDFTFIDQPSMKYDCVITMRFPPLSLIHITVDQFKERLKPYTEDQCSVVYYNVSPTYKADTDMKIWEDPTIKPKFVWYNHLVGFMDL